MVLTESICFWLLKNPFQTGMMFLFISLQPSFAQEVTQIISSLTSPPPETSSSINIAIEDHTDIVLNKDIKKPDKFIQERNINNNKDEDVINKTLPPTTTTTSTTTMKPKTRASPFLTNIKLTSNNNDSNNKTLTKTKQQQPKWVNQSLASALIKNSGGSSSTTPITITTTLNPITKRKSKFKNGLKERKPISNQTYSSTMEVAKQKVYKAPPMLKQIHDYLIVVLLVSVMFAMGCSITWKQVWGHIRRPIGVIIGMISQFILLPACAYSLIVIFRIDPLHATGLLILACSPGGVTSNVFTYFCEGDLSLSVTMTSFSTVVALLMMPFNVWLYGRNLETETLIIPYTKMSISLLSLTTPVAIGMVVNWKLPKVAPILTQIGSVAGFAIIIVCQTLEVFIFPDIFNDVPSVLYIAEFLLPLLGLVMGFAAASVLRLPYPVRRTIAIEAGIQNVGTALTIITLSFPFEQLRKVWLFPFLYAFSMLAVCCVVAVIYQLQKRFKHKTKSLNIMDHPKLQKIQQQQLKLQQQQQQMQIQYQQQVQQQQLGYYSSYNTSTKV